MHAASGSYSDGDAYLKALSNIRLVYRRAEKLSGLSRDNFESLPTVFRQHYYKTALEQFENKALCDELAMSRIRTIPEWQSQDYQYHGLPYYPLPSNGQDCPMSGSFMPSNHTLPFHQQHHGNLATTPPMPLPMVDPPFPSAPPPTPVSMYGGNNFGGDEYAWSSSFSSASTRPSRNGFKADPSSPFRFPMDNMDMHIGTVSPRDLHPELDYNNLNSSMNMPLTPEEMGMLSFSDAEIASLPASLPAYTARRPLPSAAPVPSNYRGKQSRAQSGASATFVTGSSSEGSASTASIHSSSKRSSSRLPRGSGRGCPPSESIPLPDRRVSTPNHHTVPAGPPIPARAPFLGLASSFPPHSLPNIAPSINAVADRSLAQAQALAAVDREVGTAAAANIQDIGTRSSSSSHRSSRKRSTQSHTEQHKSSPSTTSSSDRKKKASSSISDKPSSPSHKKQVTAPVPSQRTCSFPPGENRLGFVPIGCLGVASAAQGNTHPLDLALKKRIIVAERDAGLTYKAIQSKYTRWREAESTYRGLDRTARLPLEHRERVASWGEQHIQSMRKGMAMLRDPMRPNLKGFPWKQLADYIRTETGKPFGATTVKKKWFKVLAGEDGHETDGGEDSDEDDEMED